MLLVALRRNRIYRLIGGSYSIKINATIAVKDSLLSEIAKQQTILEKINYEHFVAIKNICTPNQLNNYKELTSQLAEMFDKNPKNKR